MKAESKKLTKDIIITIIIIVVIIIIIQKPHTTYSFFGWGPQSQEHNYIGINDETSQDSRYDSEAKGDDT